MYVDILGVRIHLSFFLIAFLLGWGLDDAVLTVVWVVVVFGSILLHEAGHAGAAKLFGLSSKIELGGLGGVTRFEAGKLSTAQRIFVTLAGPMAGFAVGFVLVSTWLLVLPFFPIGTHEIPLTGSVTIHLGWDTLRSALKMGMWVNIGWGMFNLLPVLPLDGGQIGLAILSRGDEQLGLKRMSMVSIGMSALVVIGALSVHMLFVGLLFGFLGFTSVRTLMSMRSLGQDRGAGLMRRLQQAQALAATDPQEALALSGQVREQAAHAGTKAAASHQIAALLLHLGDADAALAELYTIAAPYGADPNLMRVCIEGALITAHKDGSAEEVAALERQLTQLNGQN